MVVVGVGVFICYGLLALIRIGVNWIMKRLLFLNGWKLNVFSLFLIINPRRLFILSIKCFLHFIIFFYSVFWYQHLWPLFLSLFHLLPKTSFMRILLPIFLNLSIILNNTSHPFNITFILSLYSLSVFLPQLIFLTCIQYVFILHIVLSVYRV